MTITFDRAQMKDGWLMLHPSEYADRANAQSLCFGLSGVYDAEIKNHYVKRSLNANGYLWALVTKIGNALRMSKEEVYLIMLKRYGQGGAVSVQERFADSFRRTYKYNESLGKSELNGKMWEHFRFWIGSSEYNTQEMAIFLDGVIEEAKQLDIPTETPEEIARMKEEWQ